MHVIQPMQQQACVSHHQQQVAYCGKLDITQGMDSPLLAGDEG